jgi:branched-subunit amino acid aminotransferase/4-amino-4-deoxychorismate lyase
LLELAQNLTEPTKVRLLLGQDGEMTTQLQPLPVQNNALPLPVCLARTPIDSNDIWLCHKTSRRQVYEQALAACPAGYDVILWNERGEITEASSSNVIVELDGHLITPSVSSGLLAGTYRRYLLEQGYIQEGLVTTADLKRAPRLILINSVRKWCEAVFIDVNSSSLRNVI